MINSLNLFDTDSTYYILLKLRMFRLFTGFVVGGGLAVAGLAYQAVLRNPLAEPFILGISGGSAVGAASAIVLGLAAISYFAIPILSFFGAIVTLCLVLFVAKGNGRQYTNNVMLSGVIVGSVCSSILMFMISIMGMESLHSVTWWMLGNLLPFNYTLLYVVSAITVVGTVVLFLFGRDANIISLGEEVSFYVGVSPGKTVFVLLGIASLITASLVSISGIIGFIGLIVPHVLRRIWGADHRRLFCLALIWGGIFLMICDTVARSVYSTKEIPVGVITAFLGGPFFLYLLNKKQKTM
jgi:iron complex transport system permease protein